MTQAPSRRPPGTRPPAHRPVRRRDVLAFALAAAGATRASAASADPAAAAISAFCAALLASMKSAATTPVKARYDRLDPAVRAAFDLPAMTRIAVGPAWTSLPADAQQALVQQFSRMTIATYAGRFDGYDGERFEVEPVPEERGAHKVVHSRLVPPRGEPVVLNYLMRSADDGWKAIDVYLSGTISELATRRSEFGGLLRSGGVDALVASLRQRADKLLAG